MEGLDVSLMPSVGEGSSHSSPVLSTSVSGGDGQGARGEKKRKGARGTAETKKRSRRNLSAASSKKETERRDRSADWSDAETDKLLEAIRQNSGDKGRSRKSSGQSFWATICETVRGRTPIACRRRMETLTKSWNAIKKMNFTQLSEEDLRDMKLATAMTVDLYNQMCEIKKGPGNARVVSTETGLIEEGDQSSTSSQGFAAERLVDEEADPVPHQQDPTLDIVALQPLQASSGGTSAGDEEQVHQIPCHAPPVHALVSDAPVVPLPAPGAHSPRHDAHSPHPAVDAASPGLDLHNDSASEVIEDVPSLESEPHLDDAFDLDGWTEVDALTAAQDPCDLGWPTSPVDDLFHIDDTFDVLQQFSRLPGF